MLPAGHKKISGPHSLIYDHKFLRDGTTIFQQSMTAQHMWKPLMSYVM